jgi:hypothetical protein
MNPTTALCFLLAGLSLWLLLPEPVDATRTPAGRRVAQLCGGTVALAGLLRLVGYLIGWEIGVDQLLFWEGLRPNARELPTGWPQTPPYASCSPGSRWRCWDVETRRGLRAAQFLTLAAAGVRAAGAHRLPL